MLLLVTVACLGPSLATSLCFPDESLPDCLQRENPCTSTAQPARDLVTCLGVKEDSSAFVGACTDFSSSCGSSVFSRSLDCGSSSSCCQVRGLGLVWFGFDRLCCRTYLGSGLCGKFVSRGCCGSYGLE